MNPQKRIVKSVKAGKKNKLHIFRKEKNCHSLGVSKSGHHCGQNDKLVVIRPSIVDSLCVSLNRINVPELPNIFGCGSGTNEGKFSEIFFQVVRGLITGVF